MKTAMKNTAQCRRARTTTRPRCQRFTFKAVRDTEGEILYYLILPYLMIGNNAVEGFYRENYHLTLKTSGEIGICNTCAVGNPADECRWTLSGAITGMTVTNCGESVNLGVDLDEEIVAGVTAYGTDVWHVMPICLNVETDYQRTKVTCGAACGTMIVNYLKNYSSPLVTENQFLDNIGGSGNSVYIGFLKDEINRQISQANYIVGWYADLSSDNLMEKLSRSFNHDTGAFPVIMNVKPKSSEEKSNWGYAYSETSESSHFVVVNGLFYNPITNSYSAIVCDPHHKYDVVGGRTFVFDLNDLATAFYQSPEALMHKVN